MPDTRLRPEHVGEPMVAALLRQIYSKNKLDQLRCGQSGRAQDQTLQGVIDSTCSTNCGAPISFHENAPLCPLEHDGRAYSFDALSQVDCLVVRGSAGLAIEVKLGTSRMASREFRRRFLQPCTFSRHVPPRIRGKMIAVLDGRFREEGFGDAPLCAAPAGRQPVTLARSWVLLIRREVADAWAANPPLFRRDCWILLFEDLVPAAGGQDEFDKIVSSLVGDRFAEPWGLSPEATP